MGIVLVVVRIGQDEADVEVAEAVCTENLVRVDEVMESPKLAE